MQTSRDQVLWQHDAAYAYYRHGPLARTVLGELHVQGMDYAYTLQGWLKTINPGAVWHTADGSCAVSGTGQTDLLLTDRDRDPPINGQYTAQNSITFDAGFTSAGNDVWETVLGVTTSNTCTTNNLYDDDGNPLLGGRGATTARDAMGLQLDYYGDADYTPIGGGKLFGGPTPLGINFKPLYNGNIAAMMVNVPKLGEPIIYNYQYDQLNRLMAMDAYKGLNTADANWTPISINDYKERLTYDPNGNILTYQRNGTGSSMNLNNYTYTYTPGTNRLSNIANSVKGDSKNYAYDEIGNVTKDEKQDVANAVWNLYGKLQSATKTDGTQINYTYGADGQRISRVVGNTEEYYVKDATGNTMATYSKGGAAVNGGNIAQTETHVYGSSRLGILTGTVDCYNNGNGPKALGNAWDATRTAGNMRYEMTDARGNVLLTVTDRLVPVPDAGGTMIDHNLADVVNITDYSSFGAPLPGRTFGDSRYGFNGQRRSPEIGFAAQAAEFWEYNGDVGRRWNVDPVSSPFMSPYSVFSNNPIRNIDPLGNKDTICGTCGRPETHVQQAARIAIVNIARAYDADKFSALQNKEEDADVNAPQLFYQWVMGSGKNSRNFDENSTMGKQMLEAKEVEGGIDDAIKIFKPYGGRRPVAFSRSLKTENELLYVKSFIDDLDDNPARAFHGSYNGVATVIKAEETTLGVNYSLNIKIWDNMTATSGTRLPPFLGGYEKNAAIFSGANPYGPNGYFRTIKIEYDMNIKVFRYNSAQQDALKLLKYLIL